MINTSDDQLLTLLEAQELLDCCRATLLVFLKRNGIEIIVHGYKKKYVSRKQLEQSISTGDKQ